MTPSETLLRNTLLKDEIHTRTLRRSKPATLPLFADDDDDEDLFPADSFLQWRPTAKAGDRKRHSNPSPVSLIASWWRDSEDEEQQCHYNINPKSAPAASSSFRPVTPAFRTNTSSSLPVSSPISQTTRLHRHGWSLDSIPQQLQLDFVPEFPEYPEFLPDYTNLISELTQSANLTTPETSKRPPPCGFDANHAAQQCKQIEGYVSFAAIEGLGVPPSVEEDNREDPPNTDTTSKSWWSTWRKWTKP